MRRAVYLMTFSACLATAVVGAAQQRDDLPGVAGDMTPFEVQQLFDAFELVRAEEMLGLTDDQYPQFVVRLKAVQRGRREAQQQRQRMLRELQRLANQPGAEEAVLEERLASLIAHDRDAAETRAAAVGDIDAILSIRQQVRFRIFEQAMERRRLDLLMRARTRRAPQRRPGGQQR